jgi:hypothetical protein
MTRESSSQPRNFLVGVVLDYATAAAFLPPLILSLVVENKSTAVLVWSLFLSGYSLIAYMYSRLRRTDSADGTLTMSILLVLPAVGVGMWHGYHTTRWHFCESAPSASCLASRAAFIADRELEHDGNIAIELAATRMMISRDSFLVEEEQLGALFAVLAKNGETKLIEEQVAEWSEHDTNAPLAAGLELVQHSTTAERGVEFLMQVSKSLSGVQFAMLVGELSARGKFVEVEALLAKQDPGHLRKLMETCEECGSTTFKRQRGSGRTVQLSSRRKAPFDVPSATDCSADQPLLPVMSPMHRAVKDLVVSQISNGRTVQAAAIVSKAATGMEFVGADLRLTFIGAHDADEAIAQYKSHSAAIKHATRSAEGDLQVALVSQAVSLAVAARDDEYLSDLLQLLYRNSMRSEFASEAQLRIAVNLDGADAAQSALREYRTSASLQNQLRIAACRARILAGRQQLSALSELQTVESSVRRILAFLTLRIAQLVYSSESPDDAYYLCLKKFHNVAQCRRFSSEVEGAVAAERGGQASLASRRLAAAVDILVEDFPERNSLLFEVCMRLSGASSAAVSNAASNSPVCASKIRKVRAAAVEDIVIEDDEVEVLLALDAAERRCGASTHPSDRLPNSCNEIEKNLLVDAWVAREPTLATHLNVGDVCEWFKGRERELAAVMSRAPQERFSALVSDLSCVATVVASDDGEWLVNEARRLEVRDQVQLYLTTAQVLAKRQTL